MAINQWSWSAPTKYWDKKEESSCCNLLPLLEHLPTCVYSSCTPAPPCQWCTGHTTTTNIHQTTNHPQLWSLAGRKNIFGTPHVVCPAGLYGLPCVKHIWRIIFLAGKVTRKRFECGNFWGVWTPAPPPTVRAHLGFCNQRSYGGDTELLWGERECDTGAKFFFNFSF